MSRHRITGVWRLDVVRRALDACGDGFEKELTTVRHARRAWLAAKELRIISRFPHATEATKRSARIRSRRALRTCIDMIQEALWWKHDRPMRRKCRQSHKVKRKFISRDGALATRDRTPFYLRPYLCFRCGWWHLTKESVLGAGIHYRANFRERFGVLPVTRVPRVELGGDGFGGHALPSSHP